jgi:nucleoside-diphosphate kinase
VIGLMGGAKAELNLAALLARRLSVIGSTLRARPVEEKAALVAAFLARFGHRARARRGRARGRPRAAARTGRRGAPRDEGERALRQESRCAFRREREGPARVSFAPFRPRGVTKSMAIERTLFDHQADAYGRGRCDGRDPAQVSRRRGLSIVALKKIRLTEELARGFYAVHKQRAFLRRPREVHDSGPSCERARRRERGCARTADRSVRPTRTRLRRHDPRRFRTDIERNAAHGSDALATAKIEISYFFGAAEILAPVEAL